jgi:hypothetical protein
MSSDDQSDIDQSPTLPLLSSVPNQEEYIERIVNIRGLRTFLVIDHTANLRKNSKISAIWYHGGVTVARTYGNLPMISLK